MRENEPTITCPKCKTEIRLTESLAAPLIEAKKQEFEERLARQREDFEAREMDLKNREEALSKARENLDDKVSEKLKLERTKIVAEEAKKARLASAKDLEQKDNEVEELQEILKQRDVKLAEAQKEQVGLIRKQRELDDAKRELDLTVEKRIQEGLATVRDQARKEAEEELKLKVLDREQTIKSMANQIDDLKRRVEQGSQQIQGEVMELELEAILRAKFPMDLIEPVPKGEFGGDILHRVLGPLGQLCGTILWESKRTKNWTDSWLSKLRDNQRAAKAELAILVSQALPKDVDTFELIDGVWVTHPRAVLPVAVTLRYSLIEVALARQAGEGQQTKMEMVYQYITGPRFRQRVQAIAEAFSSMNEDLDKEKKVITKQWAKREEQIDRVMRSTVGMYGDIQGIAGKTAQEIEGLDLKALEAPDPNEDVSS
jgi:hypothetical protein